MSVMSCLASIISRPSDVLLFESFKRVIDQLLSETFFSNSQQRVALQFSCWFVFLVMIYHQFAPRRRLTGARLTSLFPPFSSLSVSTNELPQRTHSNDEPSRSKTQPTLYCYCYVFWRIMCRVSSMPEVLQGKGALIFPSVFLLEFRRGRIWKHQIKIDKHVRNW